MSRFLSCLPLVITLGACTVQTATMPDDSAFCATSSNPICAFINAPLRLASEIVTLPRRPYPFQPLAQELTFVDARDRVWIAPKGVLTDGASIPPAFVEVVGQPTDPSFVKAAAIHDSYCGVGNEQTRYFHTRRWQDTHRMFYEALRVGGTPERTAKTMFTAVYMGGPRWVLTRPDPVAGGREHLSTQVARWNIDNPVLSHVPIEALQEALAGIVAMVRARNPSLAEIEDLVDGVEADLLRRYPVSVAAGVSGPDEESVVIEESEEGGSIDLGIGFGGL